MPIFTNIVRGGGIFFIFNLFEYSDKEEVMMEKFLQANADYGVDTLLKVVGVLRRKEFVVSDVKMTSPSESKSSKLEIRLGDETENNFDRAIAHLEKIIGLRDVMVKEEY